MGICDFSSVFVQNHTLPPSGVKAEVQLLLVRWSSSFVGVPADSDVSCRSTHVQPVHSTLDEGCADRPRLNVAPS